MFLVFYRIEIGQVNMECGLQIDTQVLRVSTILGCHNLVPMRVCLYALAYLALLDPMQFHAQEFQAYAMDSWMASQAYAKELQ
jgi:hypothetical protein